MELQKKCFIVTPLSEIGSEIRRHADGVIKNVIEPILDKLGFHCVPPHLIDDSGNITHQVVTHLIDDEMVIVNLTGLNPNVMYELAIRHCTKKPVVVICEIGTRLPFDIAAERTVFYRNDIYGVGELREQLENKLLAAMAPDAKMDNPVTRTIQDNLIQKIISQTVEKTKDDTMSLLIAKMDQIQTAIINNSTAVPPSYALPETYATRFNAIIRSDLDNGELAEFLNARLNIARLRPYKFSLRTITSPPGTNEHFVGLEMNAQQPKIIAMEQIRSVIRSDRLELISIDLAP